MTGQTRISALVALAAHARDVASEEREDFAAAATPLAGDPRVLLVRTCHRAEVYAVLEPGPDGAPLVLPRLPAGGRKLEGMETVRHAFATAAGLDSTVVGEDQVLHQLRDSVAQRHRMGTGGSGLHPIILRLMETALHLGREARARRAGPPRSLGDVALDEMASAIGSLAGRRLLVVGAGRMARLVTAAATRRGAQVFITNREMEHAAVLAHGFDVDTVALGADDPLPEVHGVACAIAGAWALSHGQRAELIERDVPVVDLSSPPALDRELRESLADRYVSVDELARGPQDAARAREHQRLRRVLDEAEQDFTRWLQTRHIAPTIEAISARAEQHRRDELERLFRRADLADHERELVEQMSRRLVAGLIHRPIATLREDEDGKLDRAARALFAL